MTLSDVITLGKMGYSKKDVAALQEAEPNADTVSGLEQKIADLTKQISEMQANQRTAAARAPVSKESPGDVNHTAGADVDDILKNMISGGGENGNPG